MHLSAFSRPYTNGCAYAIDLQCCIRRLSPSSLVCDVD